MTIQKNQRNSSIELLRILAMFFIVCSHCSVHSDLLSTSSTLFFNNLLLDWCTLGNLGVDIFVLISGYFLCDNPNFSRKRNSIKLLTQVWFFSALGLGIYLITGHQFTWKIFIKSIFPTVFSEYWFFTIYFVLLLFVPYINMVLNKLTKMQLLKLIGSMMVLWSVIPTFTNQVMGGTELCQFVMFYLIGAYFRKYPDNVLANKKMRILLTTTSFLLLFLSSVVLRIVFVQHAGHFYTRVSILTVGCAIGLFSMAIYRKSFCNKWINKIAGCTFGIYLFHDNPLMRLIIWKEWLPKIKYYNSYLLIVAIILSVLIVMTVGTIIELIRKATVQKPLEKLVNCVTTKIQIIIQKIIKRIPINKMEKTTDDNMAQYRIDTTNKLE